MTVGAVALGVVIRDSSNKVLGALAQKIILPSSTAAMEALTCRRAMLFVKK